MRRTQIYLDEDQKKALRMIAADADATVSDLIREAIDRLLLERLSGQDWSTRLGAWQKRVADKLGGISEDGVDAALLRVRKKASKK